MVLGCVSRTTTLVKKAVIAVSGLTALTSLNLFNCYTITNEGVLTLSSLSALTHLDLRRCNKTTAAGVHALRSSTTAPSLRILTQ